MDFTGKLIRKTACSRRASKKALFPIRIKQTGNEFQCSCSRLVMTRIRSNVEKGLIKRWMKHINPCILKVEWSITEKKLLLDMFSSTGTKWKLYKQSFSGRSDIDIKNQFFALIRKTLRSVCRMCGLSTISPLVHRIKPKTIYKFLNSPLPQCSKEIEYFYQEYGLEVVIDLLKLIAFNHPYIGSSNSLRLLIPGLKHSLQNLLNLQ